MRSFNEVGESTELDIKDSDQDKVISQLIFDSEFLSKCLRRKLTPDLFVGEIRKNIVTYIFKYYERYNESPADDIIDILTPGGEVSVNIREDDVDLVVEFISRVISIKNTKGKVKQLFDQIVNFKTKQIQYNLISKLNKSKDRIDGSPEKLTEMISEATKELKSTDILSSTESIFDPEGYEEGNWQTRFGIPFIDNAFGGGFIAPNLVIIQAFTGRGKTWSVTHLAKMAARLGNDSVVLETEMANKKFKTRMRMTLTGLSPAEIRNNMNEADKTMRASMVNGAQIHIVSEEMKMGGDYRVDQIADIVCDIEDRTGKEQKLIFIDSPDDLEAPDDGNTYYGIDKSKAIFTWLRNYSQNKNKCLIVTCQSQRAAENLTWTTSGNIGDDINKIRRATAGISINASKKEVDAGFTRLLVFKNTHGPEGKACWLFNEFQKGQMGSDFGEIKGFDMKEYRGMLMNRGVSLGSDKSIK